MASQLVRRADAARNIDRILESAIHVLALDPGAGMNDVAEEAGVGRATLYRHFPTRDDLLSAIRQRAAQEAAAAVAACPLDEGSSLDCIERIVGALIELGDRYRFLSGRREQPDADHGPREQIAAALRHVVELGRRRGEITRRVPVEWAVISIRGMILAAIEELGEGRVSDREAATLATRVLLDGLAPARREGRA
jgi:TetR/AcrR family transcriptional regulator, mexCD-oprJ operon repressor